MGWLNLAHLIDCSEAEGPGKRFVIWVQGCLMNCPKCCNQDMLPIKPANIMSTDEVIALINQAYKQHHIEGITLLGGEPFLQAKGLVIVAKACKDLGLSVMCFTGYTYESLLSTKTIDGAQELLAYIDVLVDGPFKENLPEDKRNWVGSTNQRFIYLSNFYDCSIERQPTITQEWRIDLKGSIKINGTPYLMHFTSETPP